jgi:hypothetical protein
MHAKAMRLLRYSVLIRCSVRDIDSWPKTCTASDTLHRSNANEQERPRPLLLGLIAGPDDQGFPPPQPPVSSCTARRDVLTLIRGPLAQNPWRFSASSATSSVVADSAAVYKHCVALTTTATPTRPCSCRCLFGGEIRLRPPIHFA